ncbi:MAG: rod shape-determining protein RodA [Fusobacteriaceae bacterium]|nr:rod shape-determining protein RodA [Fusobacteriaceae bacterium]MBP9595296.1 rod shape-determining protein RodA [Fusobacteriaceae bacterium]MBU9917435.1 rod shape-determining protein RodA [Fusobacteriaceae bacterium]
MKISFGSLVEHAKLSLKKMKKFDYVLLLSAFLLLAIGITAVYSATYTRTTSFYQKQILWAIIGTGMFFTFSNIDYRIYSRYSKLIYIFNVVFLISVFIFGSKVLGAQRWIKLGPISIQPSELAKLFVVLTFSDLLIRNYKDTFRGFKDLILSGIHIVPIFLLVAAQPDLGTGVVILFVYMVLIFLNGIDYKTYFTLCGVGAALMPVAYFFALKPYQRQRVFTFLHPEDDLLGSGWNIIQSKIAVGSGQLFGKGFLNGTQDKLRFLPESQTDFIFAVISEEFGFVGSVTIIGLYFLLIFTILKIAQKTEDRYGQLVCYGIAAIIFFHTLVNIGMVIGVMPVKGLPLLLLSYGGSSLMFVSTMLGIVQSVKTYGSK